MCFTNELAILSCFTRERMRIAFLGKSGDALQVFLDGYFERLLGGSDVKVETERVGSGPILHFPMGRADANHAVTERYIRRGLGRAFEHIGQARTARKFDAFFEGSAGSQIFDLWPIYAQPQAVLSKAQLHA